MGMNTESLSNTVVMVKWIDGCTALKSGPGSPKSQVYYIILTLYPAPGTETWQIVSPQEIFVE